MVCKVKEKTAQARCLSGYDYSLFHEDRITERTRPHGSRDRR